jgi:hypothetical protein
MGPFLDIVVAPSYGHNSHLIRWTLATGFARGQVYVYRSENGQTGWEILNPDNPVIGRNSFEDTDSPVRDLLTVMHYRLLLEQDKQAYDSPIVGTFDKLTRREFGIVRRILQLELKSLREGRQGIEVHVRTPLTKGRTCRCVDPVTKQSSQASLCPHCYGTRIEGGYAPAVTTWISIQEWNPTEKVDDPSGKHRVDNNAAKTRALAYPDLITDDLIIHPTTDLRMAVMSAGAEYFRGMVPVVSHPNLVLLPRSDIRYQLPL